MQTEAHFERRFISDLEQQNAEFEERYIWLDALPTPIYIAKIGRNEWSIKLNLRLCAICLH